MKGRAMTISIGTHVPLATAVIIAVTNVLILAAVTLSFLYASARVSMAPVASVSVETVPLGATVVILAFASVPTLWTPKMSAVGPLSSP